MKRKRSNLNSLNNVRICEQIASKVNQGKKNISTQ